MTQQAQQVLKKSTPVDPVFINTPTGTVAVFGHEHVSKNMLQMLGTALIHDAFETIYHGVKSVVFRIDGYPKSEGKSVCATFAPDTGGICINMEKTLEKTMERSMDHPSTSLMASWWIENLLNFGHEIHHAVRWNTNRDELASSEEKREEEEERAEKYTDTLLIDLVKEYDIEPPAITNEPWFNTQTMELLGNKENDEWAENQKEMLANGYIWKHVPKDNAKETIILHTFKDLICLISGGNVEEEDWNKTIIKLPDGVKTLDEQLNGKKITIDSSPTPEPVQPTTQTAHISEDYDMYQDPVPVIPANIPVTPTQPLTTNMAYTGGIQHDMLTINRIAKQVYMKMYDFIFKSCGQLKDSDMGFSNPEAVCTIPIPLTPEESSIFVSMNHLDINGRWCTDVGTTNGLLGKVMKNTKLPAYEVNLNVNGTVYKRLFIPQNPAKRKGDQLTQRALEARAGNAIAYIMNPEDDTINKWGPSITNGEYKIPQAR
jgi:hypothetical protein